MSVSYFCFISRYILASDNEDTSRAQQQQDDDAQNNYEEEEESAPKPLSKLPSFKKRSRDVDDEENARLEEVRREIREMKNNAPSRNNNVNEEEEAEEGPVDPRQGKNQVSNDIFDILDSIMDL